VLGVFFLILILAGYLWSIYSSKLFSGPLEKLTYMIFKVSIEEPFDKKDIPKDPECIPAITFLNRISNSLKERKVSDLNPLTNLPGNLSLQEQLFASIDMKEQFSVAALDIARFSAYNHKYGFTRGDGVIRFLNSTIQSVLQEKGDKGDFVCHLGADHFVFITRSSAVDVICSAIIKTFTEHIPLFYEEEDRKRGYILSKNRQGEINKFSFMTIIIGVATNAKRPLIHPLQISHITNEIIEFLKKQEKSNYLIDRRASDREPAEYTPEDEREPAAETTSAEAEPLAQPVTEADTASIEAQSEPVPAGQGTDEVTVKSSESE
jgi:GGDEF domain-containing protein